jgi:hypothetical protein
VRVVAVTENPVPTWDWEQKDFVDEILLVRGGNIPLTGQVPLLDSHNNSSVSGVLGSARNFELTGDVLECDVFFSGTPSGLDVAQKVKEGHLTDFSVCYIRTESQWIPAAQTQDIEGRLFHGPARITTKWNLMELSVTPIGADRFAKARSLDIVPFPPSDIPPQTVPAPDTNADPAPNTDSETKAPPDPLQQDQGKRSADTAQPLQEKKGMSFIDMIFYAFTILMILFLLKGLIG